MALVTTVTVTTVGGTAIPFSGDAGLSVMRSIANNAQIDAIAVHDGEGIRIIIPFESIDHALTTVTSEADTPVEDANCVTKTPDGDDDGGGE